MIGAGPFMVGGEEFLPSAILLRGLAGDFDGDSQLTARDIDLLSAAVREGATATDFDVNGDGLVDNDDRDVWVQDLKGTYFGDCRSGRGIQFERPDYRLGGRRVRG